MATCGTSIIHVLGQEPDVVFTSDQIAQALTGRYKPSTVKFTLNELARAGDIARPRPGHFQAAR